MKEKAILLLVSLLIFSCRLPFSQQETNPNVEIIIPKSEEVKFRGWMLSPQGDKINYVSIKSDKEARFLLFLETKEIKELESCEPVSWLDNMKLLCNNGSFVLATDDFTKVPLHEIEQAAVDKFLSEAADIYRYEGEYVFEVNEQEIYLLGKDYKQNADKNYRLQVDNVDAVLQGYDYHIIPAQKFKSSGKQYSPEQDYYYLFEEKGPLKEPMDLLTVYDAITDKKLVEYQQSGGDIDIGGWAKDSSGVYFQPLFGGGLVPMEPDAIMKLNIPQ